MTPPTEQELQAAMRAALATLFMYPLVSRGDPNPALAARAAVQYADALITALNQNQQEPPP